LAHLHRLKKNYSKKKKAKVARTQLLSNSDSCNWFYKPSPAVMQDFLF
jgi:hypothetical protein